jgi:membrane dipeptidase
VVQRLPENGGIIMVTFVPGCLSEPAREWNATRSAVQAGGDALWQGQPDKVSERLEAWDEANPLPNAGISDTADHIDHVRGIAGVASIGIGGDYDGIPFAPDGLEDVSTYPALFTELARRGYSQAELEQISFGNMMRVMRAAEAYKGSVANMAPIETPVPD